MALLIEIQPGHAAPPGTTSVWHNGKQYAVSDGTFTGSTYVPSTSFPAYPMSPTVDLSPALFAINAVDQKVQQLEIEVSQLKTAVQAFVDKAELVFSPPAVENLGNAVREMIGGLEQRFDDVDQALRLVIDE